MSLSFAPLDAATLETLADIFGASGCATDPEALRPLCRDEGGLPDAGCAEAAVWPTNADQISRLLRLANEKRFAVTPRGAGSGLAGGICPVHGGVILCLERMNRILNIDTQNLVAEVEPGVITRDLRDAAAAKGLFYPPDPASLDTSSIGGNAATNAGGPACVKYGTTRDYVLGLEAVLPSGEPIAAGVRTRKGVVGYDLAHLLVGSEGTLGVITKLVLKLVPLPPATRALAALFADLESAMNCVTQILVRGHLPSALEFMDHSCLELVGDMLPFHLPDGLDNGAMLLLELDGPEALIAEEMQAVAGICQELGALELLPAADETSRQELWRVRRQVSVRIHESCEVYVPEDVVAPIGRIAALVAALPGIEAAHGVRIFAFGHAGDGNIHLNITAQDAADAPRVEAAVLDALRLTLSLGGTMSGEHGVGLAKMRFLPLELSPCSLELQRGIKRLFDPNDVLNPGKLFPAPDVGAGAPCKEKP